MLGNQLRVLIQRVRMAGRTPAKIIMPQGMRWALRVEGPRGYKTHDMKNDTFAGLPIVIDNTLKEPLVMCEPRPEDPAPQIPWSTLLKTNHL